MADENVTKHRSRQVDKQEVDNARESFLQQIVPSGTIRPWLRTGFLRRPWAYELCGDTGGRS